VWNLGDSQVSSGVLFWYTYGSAGMYLITLTVTDNDEATDTDSKLIPVGRPICSELTLSPRRTGINRSAIADVTVRDTSGYPVSGAMVSGTWSGDYDGSVTGITDADGKATFKSDRVKNPAVFSFRVSGVEKAGCFCAPECCVRSESISID
jgi:hypothetical protein